MAGLVLCGLLPVAQIYSQTIFSGGLNPLSCCTNVLSNELVSSFGQYSSAI